MSVVGGVDFTSQYHYTTMTFEHDKKNPPSLQHETMVPLIKEMEKGGTALYF